MMGSTLQWWRSVQHVQNNVFLKFKKKLKHLFDVARLQNLKEKIDMYKLNICKGYTGTGTLEKALWYQLYC